MIRVGDKFNVVRETGNGKTHNEVWTTLRMNDEEKVTVSVESKEPDGSLIPRKTTRTVHLTHLIAWAHNGYRCGKGNGSPLRRITT